MLDDQFGFDIFTGQSYKHLMKMIGSMEVTEEQKAKFSQALKGFSPLKDAVVEIAGEFQLENKLNRVSIEPIDSFNNVELPLICRRARYWL